MRKALLIVLLFIGLFGKAQTNKGVLIHGIKNGLWVNNGNLGIGITTPTARLHLPAGTATANTAPLKLTAGTNLTTPENGAVEYNGTHFYATIGSTRYQLDQQGGGITSINSQTGTSQTISGGAGIGVSSSSDVTTVSINTNLDAQVSDANNTGTSATDLYSKTIAANQLTLNGQSIHFEAAGVNNDATATVNLEALFAGNGIAGTGAVTISSTGPWTITATDLYSKTIAANQLTLNGQSK